MGNNNGVFQGNSNIRYNVVATRLSGESMTSIGNTIINYYVQRYIYQGLGVDSIVVPFGDDSITALSS